ncbi:MAG: hypothetical protein A2179_01185, partial [Elusimicrobia bacterium GWC2_63_65]
MDAPGGKKILIIDTDTPEARGLLAFLEKNGYHAQMVTNYQQSFTAMQNWKPDLVILNILIRSFNPLDFLTDLKKNPFTEAQRIVIFSQTSKAGIVTGPAPKVRAYITKPVDFEALKTALHQALPAKDGQACVMVADD